MEVRDYDATGFAVSGRRAFLASVGAGLGVLALGGCASVPGLGMTDVIRRLLERSTTNAFARLTQPDGFWDSAVARINLPVLFGKRSSIARTVLGSDVFRERLQHHLNTIAEDGARRAAPVVADAVRSISITDAAAVLSGGPTAATTLLRDYMGPALVNAMVPALGDAMRVANDPVLGQALAALSGVDLPQAAHALAIEADNAIWYEVGASEKEIRANPQSTSDPVLIAALKALG